MRQNSNIDFQKYAGRLGADASRLQAVFQKALDISGIICDWPSLAFDEVAYQLSDHFGIRLSLDFHLDDGLAFTTIDSTRSPIICMGSLEPSLDNKVLYYHELAHALMHLDELHSLTLTGPNETLLEGEAWLFSIVVAALEPEFKDQNVLEYLAGCSDKIPDRHRQAFEAVLAFFSDNWITIAPSKRVVETDAVPLIVTVNEILLETISNNPALLYNITPATFEDLMAKVFNGLGYKVEQTKRTRDGGIDILAIKKIDDISLRFLIECKRYAEKKKIDVSLVRSLFGVKQHIGASKAMIVTTSSFTKPAIEFAEAHKWELDLKGQEDILQWIKFLIK